MEIVGKLQIKGRKLFQAWEKPYAGQTVGLSGWTITATLKGTNPKVYVTTTTDAIGNYVFNRLTPGFSAGMADPWRDDHRLRREAQPLDPGDRNLCRRDTSPTRCRWTTRAPW